MGILTSLTNADSWRQKRAGNMEAARECRQALTTARGVTIDNTTHIFPARYAADAPEVKEAVGSWVKRARHCHDIAMGRKPVIPNFIFINSGGESAAGQLYAR